MKKYLILFLALLLVSTFSMGILAAQLPDTGRTVEDYTTILKDFTNADKVGDLIRPANNEETYPFVPLYKDNELIGYGTWASMKVYSHVHDIAVVVSSDAEIKKIKYIDVSEEHHPELAKQEYLKRFYGMKVNRNFDSDVDTISGSTISTNQLFGELKTILVIFNNFVEIK